MSEDMEIVTKSQKERQSLYDECKKCQKRYNSYYRSMDYERCRTCQIGRKLHETENLSWQNCGLVVKRF